MRNFELDPRLTKDTHFVGQLKLCKILLMNDSRWPWLILVPVIPGAVEIHKLSSDQQSVLAAETALCADVLQKMTGCLKINSGALGNIVRQLHVHIIGRNEGDTNWPGPVWGFGGAQPYTDTILKNTLINLKTGFEIQEL